MSKKEGQDIGKKNELLNSRMVMKQLFHQNYMNLCMSIVAMLGVAVVELISSWYLQITMDTVTGASKSYSLTALLFILVGTIALIIIAMGTQAVFVPRFKATAMEQYKNFIFERITQKNILSMSREGTSTYISALSNDLETIETGYLTQIVNMPEKVMTLIGALALMIYYSPLLTVTAAGFSLLPIIASVLTGNMMTPATTKVSEENAGFIAGLKDSLTGFSIIKAFKAEVEIIKLFIEKNRKTEIAKAKKGRIAILINLFATVAGIGCQFGVLLTGAYLVMQKGVGTAGILVVFVQLMNYVIQSVFFFPSFFAEKKAALAVMERISTALSENIGDSGDVIKNTLENCIEFKNVSYSYEGENNALEDINLVFEKNKSYAIVGGSGSGKSTLLNLLMAGSADYQGHITFDGNEIREINSDSLYELIGIIQQQVFVFNSSIVDNITMFKSFDENSIEDAMKQSGLEEIILEKGKDYLCGENGSALSGGQRQRIAIARSLLRKTSVLLVDEATAALDSETANNVIRSILDLKNMTKIVVTHSLDKNIMPEYEQIIVLKNGKCVETGTFDELMEQKGYFYSLYNVSN